MKAKGTRCVYLCGGLADGVSVRKHSAAVGIWATCLNTFDMFSLLFSCAFTVPYKKGKTILDFSNVSCKVVIGIKAINYEH